jgi:hypothetical protein
MFHYSVDRSPPGPHKSISRRNFRRCLRSVCDLSSVDKPFVEFFTKLDVRILYKICLRKLDFRENRHIDSHTLLEGVYEFLLARLSIIDRFG